MLQKFVLFYICYFTIICKFTNLNILIKSFHISKIKIFTLIELNFTNILHTITIKSTITIRIKITITILH